jgi:hypothetical protein
VIGRDPRGFPTRQIRDSGLLFAKYLVCVEQIAWPIKGESWMKLQAGAHKQELMGQGYTIIEGFLSAEELAETQDVIYSIAPRWEQHAANPSAHPAPFIPVREFPDLDLTPYEEGLVA